MTGLLPRRSALAGVLLLAWTGGARASTTFGEAGDYLRFGAGARSLGMGGAFTAVADDVTAEYWNPAALAFLDEYQLATMYAPFALDTNLYYAGVGIPLGPRGAVAASDVMLRSDGFQSRNDLNFTSSDDGAIVHNALSLSYARPFQEAWSVGARFRFLQQKILQDSGSAFAVDVSAYTKPWHGISTGLSLTNLNSPRVTLGSTPDEFRPSYRLGVGYHGMEDRLVIGVDANKTSQQNAYATAGLEYSPVSLLSLRVGWDQNNALTAGFGVGFRAFKVDYAFSSQSDLGNFSKVSLLWRWGNVYRTRLDPEGVVPNTGSIFVEGLTNEVKFRASAPAFAILRWALAIQDAEGKPVRVLGEQAAPPEVITWDMTDAAGLPVKRGRYRTLFRVEYKNGKVWEDKGQFTLDYKTNSVRGVDLNMRGEEVEPAPAAAEPADKPLDVPAPAPETNTAPAAQ